MAETTLGAMEELLASAKEETEDPEIAERLQLALELLAAVEERHVAGREGIDDALIHQEARDLLRELGYLPDKA